MNYHTITGVAGQRQAELRSQAAQSRLTHGRTTLRWRVSWSGARLSGDQPSVVLIISATRRTWPGRDRAGEVSRGLRHPGEARVLAACVAGSSRGP
jgi:hypothetical protein